MKHFLNRNLFENEIRKTDLFNFIKSMEKQTKLLVMLDFTKELFKVFQEKLKTCLMKSINLALQTKISNILQR